MNAASIFCATCGAANPPDATRCFACGNPPLGAAAQAAGSAPAALLAARALLRQRYRLLNEIGKGGMGAVYRAEDTELGNRKVAVKEMTQRGLTPAEEQEATQAFRNEALLLAGLTHPNLPRIYEQFSEDGHWYLVMDFIEGETLEEHLGRTPSGRLPMPEALKIGVQLCTVLDYLHTRQPPIIFRDLKPANIMVTPAGDIYLIDFGIARHFKPGQTKDTVAFGSAGYAAPEQYGKAQTTTQADIYSLGATLHQLLSGSDPADSPFLFAPLHLSQPAGLEALIMQMLETNPSKRPASMAIIRQDLQRMADELAANYKHHLGPAAAAPRPAAPLPPPPLPAHAPHKAKQMPLLIYRGHTDRVKTLAWSQDGTMIASGGNDKTIQLWDSATGEQLTLLPAMDWVHALGWSPDGEELAWVSKGKTLHIWDVDANNFRELLIHRLGFFHDFLTLGWSPDGTLLAAGGLNKTVEVWEAKTGKHVLTYSGHKSFLEDTAVHALAWSPDGQWIASAGADATVQVWDATTGDLRSSYHVDWILGYRGGVAWSPDGKRIASTAGRAAIHIWNAATGRPSLVFREHAGVATAVAWSPNGKYVASGGSDQTVRVWNVVADKEVHIFHPHSGEVNALAWSPDGTRLASAGDEQAVHLWQVVP